MQIESDLARSLQQIESDTGGFVAPQWLRRNEFMCFAIDNIDFNEATWSGKNSLHGTGLCVFQNRYDDAPRNESMPFERTTKQGASNRLPCTLLECNEPRPTAKIYLVDINSIESIDYSKNLEHTRLWMTSFFDVGSETDFKALTWSGFNSRCSIKFNPIKNVGFIAPLLRTPPTEYDTLYTDLMRAHRINVHYNGECAVTVLALDMQLFEMAMKLWVTNDDIKKKFVFVAGQLHTVFWALQNIGSYIKGKID